MRHALVLLLFAGLLGGCGQEAPKVLRFSGIPDQDTTKLQEKFEPFARYLEEKLGVPVEYVPTADYAASVAAFTNGQIQFAWFGGLSGVQARHEVEGAHAFAQGDADPNFYSYFIAHQDTGLERADAFPEAARGKTFTFGSRQSTSGRLMPEHFIRENTGVAPDAFFASVGFSGDHDKTVEQVETGAVQVGAVNFKVYDRRVKEGRTDPKVCRIIWQTPAYADYNFTAHPKLEEMFGAGFTKKLQKAILDLDDPEILAAFQRDKFIAAKDEEFEGILKVAEALGFLN